MSCGTPNLHRVCPFWGFNTCYYFERNVLLINIHKSVTEGNHYFLYLKPSIFRTPHVSCFASYCHLTSYAYCLFLTPIANFPTRTKVIPQGQDFQFLYMFYTSIQAPTNSALKSEHHEKMHKCTTLTWKEKNYDFSLFFVLFCFIACFLCVWLVLLLLTYKPQRHKYHPVRLCKEPTESNTRVTGE